jgi:RTA1 like protein
VIAGGVNNYSLFVDGENIVIAGLIVQAVWFAFFVTIAGLFHFHMARIPTAKS